MKRTAYFLLFVLALSAPLTARAVCYCYFGEKNDCQEIGIVGVNPDAEECEEACKKYHGEGHKSSAYAPPGFVNKIKLTSECLLAHTKANPSGAQPVTKAVLPKLNVDIPTVSFSSVLQESGNLQVSFLAEYIEGVYKFLITISITIAIVFLMIGGLQWTLGGVSSSQIAQAKARMKNAVVGLVLLLSVAAILQIVNPRLVSLDALELIMIRPVFISTEESGLDITAEDMTLPTTPPTGSKVPMYKQFDKQWAKQSYGGCGTIKSAGCGPSSAAMVMKYYGASVDPVKTAALFAQNGYRGCSPPACTGCNGTIYAALTEKKIYDPYGLKTNLIAKDEKTILEFLSQGQPIIVTVGPSIFTKKGHFIVLAGIDAQGKIIVNDPGKSKHVLANGTVIKDGHIPKSEIFPYIKAAWHIRPK